MRCKICKKSSDDKDIKWVSKELCLECSLKPKPKFYFDVKVETMIPATLIYKVLAEDAQQASDLIYNTKPNYIDYRFNHKKNIKLTVYKMGCSIILFMKNMVGR
jgi:hypothetical protein